MIERIKGLLEVLKIHVVNQSFVYIKTPLVRKVEEHSNPALSGGV